jgi:hypothetical protein
MQGIPPSSPRAAVGQRGVTPCLGPGRHAPPVTTLASTMAVGPGEGVTGVSGAFQAFPRPAPPTHTHFLTVLSASHTPPRGPSPCIPPNATRLPPMRAQFGPTRA